MAKIEPLNLFDIRAEMKPATRPTISKRMMFDAAKQSPATFGWAFSILDFNRVLQTELKKVRARSRELAANDTMMSKYLRTVVKNVVGADGIKLQSKVLMKRGRGGEDPKPNELVNDQIEAAFAEWGRKENFSLDGQMSFREAQGVALRQIAQDGAVLVRKVIRGKDKFKLKIQFINADRLDTEYTTELPGGSFVRGGVEMNSDGKPVAYWVWNRHPNDPQGGPQFRVRIPAEEILHVFRRLEVGQYDGLPWAAPSMWAMHMLKGYKEAEVVAARVGASTMGFITKELDPEATVDPNAVDPTTGATQFEAQGGSFVPLGPNEHIETFDPKHPQGVFDPFVKAMKLDIAAGMDAAYMTVSGDVGAANYSSARVGLLDERATWEELQQWWIESFCDPIYRWFMEVEFLNALSFLPGGDWRDYCVAEWHPKAFSWIDPKKDADAEVVKLDNGFTTRHRILASQGYDFDETMEELAQEVDTIKRLKLMLGSDTKGKPNDPAAADNADGGANKPGDGKTDGQD